MSDATTAELDSILEASAVESRLARESAAAREHLTRLYDTIVTKMAHGSGDSDPESRLAGLLGERCSEPRMGKHLAAWFANEKARREREHGADWRASLYQSGSEVA